MSLTTECTDRHTTLRDYSRLFTTHDRFVTSYRMRGRINASHINRRFEAASPRLPGLNQWLDETKADSRKLINGGYGKSYEYVFCKITNSFIASKVINCIRVECL